MSKNVLSAPVASYMKASGLGDALNLELTSLLADLDVNARWTSDDTPLIYLPDEDDIYSLASVLVSLFFGRHGKCLSDWLWGDTSAVYNLALLEMNWLCGAGATAGTCPFEIGAFTGVRACGLKERRKMRVACFYGLLLRLSDEDHSRRADHSEDRYHDYDIFYIASLIADMADPDFRCRPNAEQVFGRLSAMLDPTGAWVAESKSSLWNGEGSGIGREVADWAYKGWVVSIVPPPFPPGAGHGAAGYQPGAAGGAAGAYSYNP